MDGLQPTIGFRHAHKPSKVLTSNVRSTKKNVLKIIHPPAAYLQKEPGTEQKKINKVFGGHK